ncbi:MAG: DUF1194 domain-containing protein [Marinibacterium profundimaris]
MSLPLSMAPAAATAECRQALVLALDVSGSVDSIEYRMQLDGLAAALNHPEVRRAILAMPQAPVDIAVFEWSAPDYQRHLVPWTSVTSAGALDGIIARLRGTARTAAPPGTALGSAVRIGGAMLDAHPGCWIHTLDVSGDGKHNMGPHPRSLQPWLAARDITVNALVIGVDDPRQGDARQDDVAGLSSYFRAYVIAGPGAFVETALGFADYEAAMVRKLLRELEGLNLATLKPDNPLTGQ